MLIFDFMRVSLMAILCHTAFYERHFQSINKIVKIKTCTEGTNL